MLGEGDERSREDEGERKVYHRRSSKPNDCSSNLMKGEKQMSKSRSLGSEVLSSLKRSQKSGLDLDSEGYPDGLSVMGDFLGNKVRISLLMKSKHDALELRRKLEGEREMVRSLMRKLEAKELEKNAHSHRFDAKDVAGEAQMSMASKENNKSRIHGMDKEKRATKVNKLYTDLDFPPGKGRAAGAENSLKSKPKGKNSHGSGKGTEAASSQALKSCGTLLQRLMKHKHGWVLNQPVDTVALGLHDYFDVIKSPMDLGTVKDRLENGGYKSPKEFANDVRLTFRNAMTYNSKGQDVYVMAEQLSSIFESKWSRIEADFKHENAEEEENVVLPVPASASSVRKTNKAASKKPKAKDPNKREMTYDEKQKLSINLQDLPAEKLDNVVQIIKKRNPSVSQQDDEIEVDIDTVDTETLWELDRFVTNYKKNLSKNKRKAEIVGSVVSDAQEHSKDKITIPETQKESLTFGTEEQRGTDVDGSSSSDDSSGRHSPTN